jgi:hypothetical protein
MTVPLLAGDACKTSSEPLG